MLLKHLWEVIVTDNSYPAYLFHQGTNYYSYEYLGVNSIIKNGEYQYTFRVWAPNADKVGLISDFSGWENPIFMKKNALEDVFELTYTSCYSLEKQPYKYRIFIGDQQIDKGDPYARFSRGGADGASLILTASNFTWNDDYWLCQRKTKISNDANSLSIPINIYELHFGSFLKHFDNRNYSYRELAAILPSYLKKNGYTHVEFMPIQEYPFDGSWGYQVCGFYAITSRFGDPDDFKYLIDTLHSYGIGVILDWVCAHLSQDNWGLYKFDGSHLYNAYDEKNSSNNWGTSFFDFSKPEIHSFLISNALYFLREFHIDGIRVDAVSSIIYYDNSVVKNENGINFLKKLNSAILLEFSDILTFAEESTNYGKTTLPLEKDGLGFSMKWNMGWSNDFKNYVSTDPIFRKYKHQALTFPIHYAFKEKYCMPISHDDVGNFDSSFLGKMHGSIEDKFLLARLSLLLMMTYPGKKLMFMGTEFAQLKKWNYNSELDWSLLQLQNHKHFNLYTSELNKFYLSTPELWEIDFYENGFRWIYPDEADKNIIAFKRISKKDSEIIIILNFSGVEQKIYIPANSSGYFSTLFTTGNIGVGSNIYSSNINAGFGANILLPRLSGIVIKEHKN